MTFINFAFSVSQPRFNPPETHSHVTIHLTDPTKNTHQTPLNLSQTHFPATWQMKEMGSYHGRPRLRDRVDTSEEHKLRLDTRLGTWESYQGWCQLHQFPNVLSESVKDRLYFLASQTTWDWRRHVSRVLSHHGDLAEKITQYPVTRPDLRVLSRCIETLSMNGTPPFQEMTAFKVKCFRSFPVSHVQKMNLTQILRLYVCIYQNHTHWKELWKQQLSLLSPQIIKDCETFAATVPFAEDAVMALLCKTSPHH